MEFRLPNRSMAITPFPTDVAMRLCARSPLEKGEEKALARRLAGATAGEIAVSCIPPPRRPSSAARGFWPGTRGPQNVKEQARERRTKPRYHIFMGLQTFFFVFLADLCWSVSSGRAPVEGPGLTVSARLSPGERGALNGVLNYITIPLTDPRFNTIN
jgi:hypothetical protein